MKILLTGANGFIGRYLLAALLRAGHAIVPAVRDVAAADRLLPEPSSIYVDFNQDTAPDVWLPRLEGIDAVINCVGILQSSRGQSIDAIHFQGPVALFDACKSAGVRRVIQISAISAQAEAQTDYAQTKRAADEHLRQLDLDWVIIKPSLVYAPGAYGGTALMRALAALPLVVPVVGAGDQTFRPVNMDDLCDTILECLTGDQHIGETLALVGPEEVTLRDILVDLRRWLGFREGLAIHVPRSIIAFSARIGDFLGGPINTTALWQLEFGNAGANLGPGERLYECKTGWRQGLMEAPAQTQDRWHARLYFLRPLLRWVVGLTWIVSGVIGLASDFPILERTFGGLGLGKDAANLLFNAASIADLVMGLIVLVRWRPALSTSLQIALVAIYTVAMTLAMPGLWLDPFGPLLKNFAFIAAILALAAIERDR